MGYRIRSILDCNRRDCSLGVGSLYHQVVVRELRLCADADIKTENEFTFAIIIKTMADNTQHTSQTMQTLWDSNGALIRVFGEFDDTLLLIEYGSWLMNHLLRHPEITERMWCPFSR